MDEQHEVIIVDEKGTEHVFPPGFDPKKAAAIVRAQSRQPIPTGGPIGQSPLMRMTHIEGDGPGGKVPEHEPGMGPGDTAPLRILGMNFDRPWWNGFTKQLKKEATAGWGLDNPNLVHTAQPETIGDIATLMMPEVPKSIIGGFKILGNAGKNAMSDARAIGAARNTSSIREFPKQLMESLSKEWNRPEIKGPGRGASLLRSKDAIDYPTRDVPPWNAEPGNPEGWRQEPMPGPEPFEHPEWSPETADPEGWRKTAGSNFGGKGGETPLGATETPGNPASGGDGASTPAPPPESLDSVLEKMVLEQHNPGAMAQQAQDLRRQVGSRDAARQMFGTANPETQGAIRTMSPGPSQTPTDALERIQQARKLAAQGVDGMSPEEIQNLIRSIEGSGQ